MGRSPRTLIEGGIYHVYSPFSRGEHPFRDEPEGERLLKRHVESKRRDDFHVLPRCLMSFHYRVAPRMSEVPLSRSTRFLNQRFAQNCNGRHRVAGSFRNGRYWPTLGKVARGLEKYVETASRLLRRAAARRLDEQDYRAMVKAVDAAVIDRYGER